MVGSNIQLFAIGPQDFHLTGNPQITFFKSVFRRHTNFMKDIRKLQNNAILLQEFNKNLNQIYDAYIYEKNMIYIPEINLLTKIKEKDNVNYCDLVKVKLFYFLNEANFKQKIKVQYI